MDGMGLGLLGVRAARHEAESARPWAPVVPGGERGRAGGGVARSAGGTARPRRALADALHHLADVVAPAPDRQGHLLR